MKDAPCPRGLEDLQRENRALRAEYGRAQQRCSRTLTAQARQITAMRQELMRLRAAVVTGRTALLWAREDRAAMEARIPGLPRRLALARQVEALVERVRGLMRERLSLQTRAPVVPLRVVPAPQTPAVHDLREKVVLCVGPNEASASVTRRMVETAGGRFLRHEGADPADPQALDASLRLADLVICQAGCVSDGDFWRAQDHCRRTGKRCVLVDNPNALDLVRGGQHVR